MNSVTKHILFTAIPAGALFIYGGSIGLGICVFIFFSVIAVISDKIEKYRHRNSKLGKS